MNKPIEIYKKHFFVFCMFFLMVVCNACTPSKNGITILNSGNDSFASFRVRNPYGRAISFVGSENAGAIGYELNGKIFWLKVEQKFQPLQMAHGITLGIKTTKQ